MSRPPKEFFSISEAVEAIGHPEKTIREIIALGELEPLTWDDKEGVTTASLDAYFKSTPSLERIEADRLTARDLSSILATPTPVLLGEHRAGRLMAIEENDDGPLFQMVAGVDWMRDGDSIEARDALAFSGHHFGIFKEDEGKR